MTEAIYFDWNGTLLDDSYFWYQVLKRMFAAFGVKTPTQKKYFQELVENSGDYLKIYWQRGVTASREKLNAMYEREYEKFMPEMKLFSGAIETLTKARERNIYIFLVTGQLQNLVSPLLEKFGIRQLFHDSAFHAIDKERVIREMAQKNHVALKNCFLVGDLPSDIKHAKKAEIKAISLVNKYTSRKLTASADYHIHSIEEILNLI